MQRTGRLKLKDKSTLSKREYIVDHILLGTILGYDLVSVVLPHLVPITYFDKSLPRMVSCMVEASLFGIVFSYNSNRTNRGVLC